MDVLNSSFRAGALDRDVNYIWALAGALVNSDCIKKYCTCVFNDNRDGVCNIRIKTDLSDSLENWKGVFLTDLRFNVPFDKNEQSADLDYIYIRLSDTYGNRMFVSYAVDDEARFNDFALWLGKAIEHFAGIVDCDRVRK